MPIRCQSFKMLCNQVFVVIKRLRRCKNNGQGCKKVDSLCRFFTKKSYFYRKDGWFRRAGCNSGAIRACAGAGKRLPANQRCTMAKEGNLLIVDDNSSILGALRLLLERHFAKVTTLTSPKLLDTVLRGEAVDAVLLDMNFTAGVNNGNEGIYWLRRIPRHTSRREGRSLYGLCRCRSGSAVHARRCGRFRGQALG